MLCSGTTIGTRLAILKYLDIMYNEMKVLWISAGTKCHFPEIPGGDQAIHNYLYYTGQIPFATVYSNRGGISNGRRVDDRSSNTNNTHHSSIVHTVGARANKILLNHAMKHNLSSLPQNQMIQQAKEIPFVTDTINSSTTSWIGSEYQITNTQGYFVENDGITISRVIHQYDRFGPNLVNWLYKQHTFDNFTNDELAKLVA